MTETCADHSFYLSSDTVNTIHASVFGVTLCSLMFSYYWSDYVPPRITKVKSKINQKKSD